VNSIALSRSFADFGGFEIFCVILL
jgi:hypothetical protein